MMEGYMNWKYDYKVHFETVIRNMRFDDLSDVYSFLTDAAWYAEYNDDVIAMEDFIDLYRDTPGTEDLVYDSDGVKEWGVSLQSLQFAKIYKEPKLTYVSAYYRSEHIDFEKPCRYYLVIRGVENVEDFKNG